MKTLKESLLDDEDDVIVQDAAFSSSPEYFKKSFKDYIEDFKGRNFPGFRLNELILLCMTIYSVNHGKTMELTDDLCDKIEETFKPFGFKSGSSKIPQTVNFVYRIINEIIYANKGLFSYSSPFLKNGYIFEDPGTYKRKELNLWEFGFGFGIANFAKEMSKNNYKIVSGKIDKYILETLKLLDTASNKTYLKASKYMFEFSGPNVDNYYYFRILWLPSSLQPKYKEFVKIMMETVAR